MKRARVTTGAATGLTLALALAACAPPDSQGEGPTEPGPSQEETGADTDNDETGAESTDDGDDQDSGPSDLSAVMPESTGEPFADLRTAAEHMPETGENFATGFTAALDLSGDPQSETAQARGEMTALFQEHVHLTGIAVATGYHAGTDSDQFELASEAVDANSVALADVVGDLLGAGARESFLRNWREHIDYLLDYAIAAEAGDEEAMDQALEDLREYTEGVGRFFDRQTDGELDVETVTESFDQRVEALAMAVDSLAAGDADAFAHLKEASDHAVDGSALIAEGLGSAAGLVGDPQDQASELRTALTANLNEHVYVAGTAVFVAYTEEDGTESDAFDAAAAVVDDNAVELADAIGELAGEENREPFLDLWRDHIDYFVDYAEATANNDDAAAENALLELHHYRYDAGEFFDEISAGELPAEEITERLGGHVQTLSGAIDSLNEALLEDS